MRHFPGGVWTADFEFHPARGQEGNPPVPVCMVARELITGHTFRLWQDELNQRPCAPFPTDSSALFVAYYASAEISCFLALGWPIPTHIVDLFIAFRMHTNGKPTPSGSGLVGALAYFGLDAIAADEKDFMRNLVLRGGSWSDCEQKAILEYCESDVDALVRLLPAMADVIDWQRLLVQGRYTVALANMERRGIPIDTKTLGNLNSKWGEIKHDLIAEVDANFGFYEGTTFKSERFERYIEVNNIRWPVLESGYLNLSDDTFREMARSHPHLNPIKELRSTLSKMRLSDLSIGEDGRNRCMLSMFRSKTGRNQPSSSKFIFGPSTWMRGFIQAPEGYGLAYVDWSQQEFGIAAALSGDKNMMEAYHSGDPYLAFAKQAGAVPFNATKQSHKAIRDQFKACVLAVQYGMEAESLACRINQPVAQARHLLSLHRHIYSHFWLWSEAVLNQALLGGGLWTTFGWQYFVNETPNNRSLRCFPMQANGGEMLRLACSKLVSDGIGVCATVHDAILIEAPLAELDDAVKHTQETMRMMSSIVLDGFPLDSDSYVIRSLERYMDDRGAEMWSAMMKQLDRSRDSGLVLPVPLKDGILSFEESPV